MRPLSWTRAAFKSLFRKQTLDRELDDELNGYLELLTDEKVRAGLTPEAARRAARVEIGGIEQVKEHVREARSGSTIDSFLQDLRYAVRTMAGNPGFTIVAIVILAIGIGATTALFSSVSAALLRPIPYADPQDLVAGFKTRNGVGSGPVSRVDYYDYRDMSESFEELAALTGAGEAIVGGSGEPELVPRGLVTWNFFRLLGVGPVAGRSFSLHDEEVGGAGIAMIGQGLAVRRFGSAEQAVGSSIVLENVPHTVVGVVPVGFRFMFDAEVWGLVHRDGPWDMTRDSHSHTVVGRLANGVTVDQAQEELDAISSSLEREYPESNDGKALGIMPLHDYMVWGVRTSLLLLMGTTVLVLLIACGNVAGLLLARGQRRMSEMAMRTALGAPRQRLVRQLLTESVILTLLAGVAGVGVAYSLQGFLLRLLPVGDVGIEAAAIDGRALSFALVASVATGLLVGVVPALRATAVSPSRHLGTGGHTTEGVQSARLRGGLVVLQVALSILLLVGSGLLLRGLVRIATVDLGFETDNLLTGDVRIFRDYYPSPEERNLFFNTLVEKVETLPGVESATVTSKLPIRSAWQDWPIWRADRPRPEEADLVYAMARWSPPGYFRTMRIPLLVGRDIADTDAPETTPIVVIGESVASSLFPDESSIGRSVYIGLGEGDAFEVVGVVGDARVNRVFTGPDPVMYMASTQFGPTRMSLAVRTAGDPIAAIEPVRRVLRSLDEDIVFARPGDLRAIIDESVSGIRTVAVSAGVFAAIALALAAIGLYGTLAYSVNQRLPEIGIRLALGASSTSLIRLVVRHGLLLVAVGLAIGIGASIAGNLALRSMIPPVILNRMLLFETSPLDPSTYAGAAAFLAVVAAAACLIPAWRASRVNAVDVLRAE